MHSGPPSDGGRAVGQDDAMREFDLIILGSGSGNSVPCDDMAGWDIAMVEPGVFGGTCLNRGCIPSKMLIYPADVITQVHEAAAVDVTASGVQLDWPALTRRTFDRIDPISAGGRRWRAEESGVALYDGTARFVGERTVQVGDDTLRGRNVVIATGARPHIPDIAGLDGNFHTSDTVMRIERPPEHLIVFGAGVIAHEMAHVFSAAGSKVTIISRHRVLGETDRDVAHAFRIANQHRFDYIVGSQITGVEGTIDDITVTFADRAPVHGDVLLVATGREPNGDLLDAAAGGISLDRRNRVVCDEYLRTSAEGVWALGDARNPIQLKHLANRDARVVQHNLLHPDDLRAIDERAVPYAVFSHPQIAGVGATEQELEARGAAYVVGSRDIAGVAYGWAMGDPAGFAKVLIDPVTHAILGLHVIGHEASLLIQPAVVAMQAGLDAHFLAYDVTYPHPALSEVLENALLDALERAGTS